MKSKMTPQALYLENESWLRTVVRSRISEQDAVEDIMQNIALALVRQRDALEEINKVGAWLYQIAIRQVLMYRRTRGRRRRFENRVAENPAEITGKTESPNPLERVLAAEKQEHVQEAIRKLEDIDRQVLLLKYSEGWTYRQLADHLGVKEDTVEYRLAKARKKLRRLLNQSVVNPSGVS